MSERLLQEIWNVLHARDLDDRKPFLELNSPLAWLTSVVCELPSFTRLSFDRTYFRQAMLGAAAQCLAAIRWSDEVVQTQKIQSHLDREANQAGTMPPGMQAAINPKDPPLPDHECWVCVTKRGHRIALTLAKTKREAFENYRHLLSGFERADMTPEAFEKSGWYFERINNGTPTGQCEDFGGPRARTLPADRPAISGNASAGETTGEVQKRQDRG